jgi:hypothetical protein
MLPILLPTVLSSPSSQFGQGYIVRVRPQCFFGTLQGSLPLLPIFEFTDLSQSLSHSLLFILLGLRLARRGKQGCELRFA